MSESSDDTQTSRGYTLAHFAELDMHEVTWFARARSDARHRIAIALPTGPSGGVFGYALTSAQARELADRLLWLADELDEREPEPAIEETP